MEQNKTARWQRSRKFGLCAFAVAMISLCVLIAIGAKLLLSFRAGTLAASDVSLVTNGMLASGIIALAGLVLAIVTFCLRGQRKGFAAFATVIALAVFLLSGAVTYFYHYMFGTVTQDEEFVELSKEELHVVEPDAQGRIDFEKEQIDIALSKQEIEQKIAMHKVEWEYLVDEDIPTEALAYMNQKSPTKKGYLDSKSEEISNYLLFGLDRSGASDSVMIFSMDRVHKKVKLISLPRDSYVKIPEWGTYTKLTYAYTAGGSKTAVGTVNRNYSMNVADYISVEIDNLKKIIDYVGGVEITLDSDELYYMEVYGHKGLQIGKNHMNGAQALTYSRMRDSSRNDNEIKRTGRQREVLQSLFDTVMDMPVGDYPSLVRYCMELCTTSFETARLLGLVMEAVGNGYTFEQYALVDHVDYWGGQFGPSNYFYVVYDLDCASDAIYRLIYEDLYASGYED